jgi:hypothetical protein
MKKRGPRVGSEGKRLAIAVTLPEALIAELRRLAGKGMNFSRYLETVIRKGLEK